jgi:hypothetical protein
VVLVVEDPVPYLYVFAQRYRDRRLSLSGNPCKSCTVADVVRWIGQNFARLGSQDPRYDGFDKIDYRLSCLFTAYNKTDKAPIRVKSVPVTIVVAALRFTYHDVPNAERQAVTNIICPRFYFCLRPGEYTGTNAKQAFTLGNVAFFLGTRRLHNKTACDRDIEAANGGKGVVITHARSTDPYCCPVTCAIRQVLVHRHMAIHKAKPYDGKMKPASYYSTKNVKVPVKAAQITKTRR